VSARVKSASPSRARFGGVRGARLKPRQSAASKTKLSEDLLVRNAVASGDRCLSLRVAPALLLRVGLVIGWRIQKRQENRIGAEIVDISQGCRNLFRWKLVYQLMKLLFPFFRIAIHIDTPPESLHPYLTAL